ncbi:PREDICTED: uncharacterized protein LOC109241336 [Nicotiana attenuata]|uniref:uncharacterized protein LOC109241336 n=1 Tax=Nicotiana attenuata TaxID=49451 RepID=UPI000904D3ED|nr:PREDICTED: uncharacterized protein LOC109241336 [Nicotiana attenuata]
MTLPNVSEGMAVVSFQNGLSRSGSRATKKLLRRLMKYPPTTWDEIHNAYYAEVRADEVDLNGPTQRLTSVQMESRKDRRNDSRRDLAGSRPNRERHQPYVRGTLLPPPRHDKGSSMPRTGIHQNGRGMPPYYQLTILCFPLTKSLHIGKARPKGKMVTEDEVRPKHQKVKRPYEFHQERGHKTEDCIALRQEVVNMLHQWHLKELMSDRERTNFARGREQHQGPPKPPSPVRTIQMIIGEGDDASINSMKFTTTHNLKLSITHERYDELEESIIFYKSDTHGLVFPHYDALVITLRIFDTDVRRIMVDDGSGACINHPRVLTQRKLEDRKVPRCIRF